MWFSNRYYSDTKNHNQFLSNLEEEKYKNLFIKLENIFELFFEGDDLFICECCDCYFKKMLSSSDLRELSNYFLDVAKYFDELTKKDSN